MLSPHFASGAVAAATVFSVLLSTPALAKSPAARQPRATRELQPAPPPIASHEVTPEPAPPRSRTTARVLFPLNVGPAVVTSTVSNLTTPLRALARGEKPGDTWPVSVIGAPVIGPVTGITGALGGYWFWELWDWEVTRVNDIQPDRSPLPSSPAPAARRRAAR